MPKPTPNRTLGPLHFEDLEPHRFEDLTRQLLYDFRSWSQLEPTGRAGSDDGFDVRGFERTYDNPDLESDQDGNQEPELSPQAGRDQLWLIQCKREKRISPKQLVTYLDGMPLNEPLYGFIFVAACDFSKAAHDVFRAKTRAMGVSEAYLWGKAAIEDMLFQPKNDHLLFGYFGVSLQIRQRSLKTNIRARIATKRKAKKVLENFRPVLLRDASDDRYPYLDGLEDTPRLERGHWLVREMQPDSCRHDGIHILIVKAFAFIDDDGVSWDYDEFTNDAYVHEDPWKPESGGRRSAARQRARAIWGEFPEKNRAFFEVFHLLPYDNILAIDEDGDDWLQGPHFYTTPFKGNLGPFLSWYVKIKTTERWNARHCSADDDKRVQKFPREPVKESATNLDRQGLVIPDDE